MLHKTLTLFARKISLDFPPLLAITIFAFAGFFLSFSSASALVVGAGGRPDNSTIQTIFKESGGHSLRIGYQHGNHDAYINWAASNGIGVLFFLGYGAGCNATTPAGRQCYADRSASLVQKYGNKVQYYEVWNEWNGGLGLGGYPSCLPNCQNAAMYTDLLCKTYKAIKAVKPNAIVLGGVTAGTNSAFISRMLDAGAGNCMDMVSIHPYPYHTGSSEFPVSSHNAPASEGAAKFAQAVTHVHDLVQRKTGKNMKVVVSEDGYSAGNAASQQRSADFLTALYNKGKTIPFLEGIWWFAYYIPGHDSWSMISSSGQKRPQFFAFQAMAKGTPNTGPSPTPPSGPPTPPPPPPGPHVILTVTPACFP